jgi:hypothetical protein
MVSKTFFLKIQTNKWTTLKEKDFTSYYLDENEKNDF